MKTIKPDQIFSGKKKTNPKKKFIITFSKKDLDIFGIPLYNKDVQKYSLISCRDSECARKQVEVYRGSSYQNILDYNEPIAPILFLSDNMERVKLEDIDINGDYWNLFDGKGEYITLIRTQSNQDDEEVMSFILTEIVSLYDSLKNRTQLEIYRDFPYGQERRFIIVQKKNKEIIIAQKMEKRLLENRTELVKA